MSYSDKASRRLAATQHPSFFEKRFRFSSPEEARGLFQAVREAHKEVQALLPSLVSVTLFGSRVKGYAAHNSDVDIYAILDESRFPSPMHRTWQGEPQSWESVCDKLLSFALKCRGYTADVLPLRFSHDRVRRLALEAGSATLQFLTPILLLAVDSPGIQPFRQTLFDALEELERESPGRGQDRWRMIRDALCFDENQIFPAQHMNQRLKLYPETIEEAKRMFLR